MLHLPTFDELGVFVHRVLCNRAQVDDETPLVDSTLYRQGQPCGVEYLLLGPRTLRLSAIWEAAGGRILFYDEGLERFQVTAVRGPSRAEILSRPRSDVRIKSIWHGK